MTFNGNTNFTKSGKCPCEPFFGEAIPSFVERIDLWEIVSEAKNAASQ